VISVVSFMGLAEVLKENIPAPVSNGTGIHV
jgi:hypothetical protein